MWVKCSLFRCGETAEATTFLGKTPLLGEHGGPPYGPSVFRYRVIGWYRLQQQTFCSLDCYIQGLGQEHYDHLRRCHECNYDKDCFICCVDDGSCKPTDHACNCLEGPGDVRFGAGWAAHLHKRIKRLKQKHADRSAVV